MIPPFNSEGLLPAGDYEASFEELRRSILVVGPTRMWHKYRVELYPHLVGLGSGIRDRYGNELEFPSAFRQSRSDGKPRGIVKIRYGGGL